MLCSAEVRPLGVDDLMSRRKALRDAVICIGWLKLVSVICCLILYFLVHANSKGTVSTVIQIMILVTIPLQIIHGVLLFLGALEGKTLALECGLWLCLILASYNTVLGVLGGIYFIRTGFLTMHFMLAVTFGMLALSLFTVLCHDVVIIYAYKQFLKSITSSQGQPCEEVSNRAITCAK